MAWSPPKRSRLYVALGLVAWSALVMLTLGQLQWSWRGAGPVPLDVYLNDHLHEEVKPPVKTGGSTIHPPSTGRVLVTGGGGMIGEKGGSRRTKLTS